MAAFVVLVYALIVLADPVELYKQGLKRDFYVCSALCLLSFGIAFTLAIHIRIPSPSPLIVQLIDILR